MGGEFEGKMDACICMAESLYCSPETITTLLIIYPPLQNKKPKINFKNIKYIQTLKKRHKIHSPVTLEVRSPKWVSQSQNQGLIHFGDAWEESVHLLLWIECLCPPKIHMLKSVPSVTVVWR